MIHEVAKYLSEVVYPPISGDELYKQARLTIEKAKFTQGKLLELLDFLHKVKWQVRHENYNIAIAYCECMETILSTILVNKLIVNKNSSIGIDVDGIRHIMSGIRDIKRCIKSADYECAATCVSLLEHIFSLSKIKIDD